ncbi:MAG TPA: PilT/PilU family type 4a pilus ATPase [Candidatus Saccharimonadales bacterium]|nr:PilT/PilU family type 4a pilus ATPase [Candidatus Saccharimonadales bacterium]
MDLFYKILKAAVDAGASDVHIKVGTPIVFRISRQLTPIEAPYPTNEWMENVANHIIPAHLKASFQTDRESDFSYKVDGIGRFRTNVFQQRGEMAIVMRAVKHVVPDFHALGLPEVLKSVAEYPRGIVLLAGTTGSGKSTTLGAMIEHINANFKRHIVTLEDPIEFIFEDNQSRIEQREVGLDTQSFARGLKSALRQDPDVIMIGEMRDAITMAASMSAADTGNLVFSTVHTTNSSQSVTRILDFFRADERDQVRRQLAATLKAVICQRMCRTVDGGMTPACEIMLNTPVVRKMIEENRIEKLGAAIETGHDDGMQDFNKAVFNLVQEGRITKEEAMLKAGNAQALEMNFKGIFLSSGSRILG